MKQPFTVVFIQRKARLYGNFSVEFIFDAIRQQLPSTIRGQYYPVKYESSGLWKRMYIALESAFHQGDVNHVTGDIHYATAFLRKKKSILTILDIGLLRDKPSFVRRLLKLFWVTIPVRRAGIVTAISQATKDEILKEVSCDPDKIRVIYVPISDDFQPSPKPFNTEKPTILQLGCAPNKNILRLTQALEGIPCHLEIVGKLGQAEQQALHDANLSHHVSWNLSNEEVIAKYQACDIVSLVSTYEGFGMPIIEGNAIGRAVITSNMLSMPEVAGDAACLVDPFDVSSIRRGFLKIIQDQTFREHIIAKGYTNRERFRIHKIARDYCNLYEEVARGMKQPQS